MTLKFQLFCLISTSPGTMDFKKHQGDKICSDNHFTNALFQHQAVVTKAI